MKYDTKKVIFEKWKESILELYGFSNARSLIDLGCGTGNFLIQIRKKFPDSKLTGIESDASMIEFAKEKALKQNAHNINFKNTNIPEFIGKAQRNKYDVVSVCHFLYYLPDIPKTLNLIKENLMKKKAVLFVTTDSMNDMPELYLLLRKIERKFGLESKCGHLNSKFGLENGYELLKRNFKYVDYHSVESDVIVNSSKEVIDYIVSRYDVVMPHLPKEKYDDATKYVYEFVEEKIKDEKKFTFTRKTGALICTN